MYGIEWYTIVYNFLYWIGLERIKRKSKKWNIRKTANRNSYTFCSVNIWKTSEIVCFLWVWGGGGLGGGMVCLGFGVFFLVKGELDGIFLEQKIMLQIRSHTSPIFNNVTIQKLAFTTWVHHYITRVCVTRYTLWHMNCFKGKFLAYNKYKSMR